MKTIALHRQGGVMLIEALIGILIFSIGILALIGMQATAVKNTTDARYRSEAAYLANSIISQMRLDVPNVAAYDDGSAGTYAPRSTWRTQIESTLPGVNIAGNLRVPSIAVAAGPTFVGDGQPSWRITVILTWIQPGETDPHQFQMVGYISCPGTLSC
jgi:type IV pilus assembly protein PilV